MRTDSQVSFIFPSFEPRDLRGPQLGVYLLAAVIRDEEYGVQVYDSATFLNLGEIDIRKSDYVCISATSLNWIYCRHLIELVKSRYPEKKVIVGGVHATNYDRRIVETTRADFVVRGEGEKALPLLLKCLRSGSGLNSVPNLTYRASDGDIRSTPSAPRLNKSDLSKLPPPAFELLPDGRYMMATIEFSRGCPFKCVFCSSLYKGRRVEFPIDKVIKNIVDIYSMRSKFLRHTLFFVDDCFIHSKKRLDWMLDCLGQEGVDFQCGMETRISELRTEYHMTNLVRLNPIEILVGVECGYEQGLSQINKNIRVDDVLKSARLLKNWGMNDVSIFSFIIGFPWEKSEHCFRTLEFAKKIYEEFGIRATINWWFPLPSVLLEDIGRYGATHDDSIYDEPAWDNDLDILKRNWCGLTFGDVDAVQSHYLRRMDRGNNVVLNLLDRDSMYAKKSEVLQNIDRIGSLLN